MNEFEFLEIEAYLPMQKKLRQWSDRKKWVQVPLIAGYIFVHIALSEYNKVLTVSGIVAFIWFEGKAAIIPDEQITSIKKMLEQTECEITALTENFESGDEIEVIGGPLIGVLGTLINLKGKKRVAVQLKQLNISFIIDLPLSEIKKVK